MKTDNVVMWVNTAKQCRLGLFQDSDFAGDLEDSKSTSGGTLCIFGSHTLVPRSWMCEKQTAQSLLPGELLFAFLDDIYVVSQPGRIREVYDMLGTASQEQAGIRLHSGKTRVWNKAGIHPLDIDDLGPEVWCKDGVRILGTPVGSDSCVEVATEERINEESRLWAALAWVPDLQCAWQILLQCAGPRCHHFLRTTMTRE